MIDRRDVHAATQGNRELSASVPERAPGELSSQLDERVPIADNVGNDVLVDNARPTRWAGLVFTVCALALLPWIVFIASTLPSRQLSPNYDIAWAGYDAILFAALACTAGGTLRRSRHIAMTASWSAALLVVDAWFDVMTSPSGRDRLEAVLMAAVVELPLAAVCVWLTLHTQDIADRRLKLVLRRARGAHPDQYGGDRGGAAGGRDLA